MFYVENYYWRWTGKVDFVEGPFLGRLFFTTEFSLGKPFSPPLHYHLSSLYFFWSSSELLVLCNCSACRDEPTRSCLWVSAVLMWLGQREQGLAHCFYTVPLELLPSFLLSICYMLAFWENLPESPSGQPVSSLKQSPWLDPALTGSLTAPPVHWTPSVCMLKT